MLGGFWVVKSLSRWNNDKLKVRKAFTLVWVDFDSDFRHTWLIVRALRMEMETKYTNKLELTKPWPQEFFARRRRSNEKKNWRHVSSPRNLSVLGRLRHSARFCYLKMCVNRTLLGGECLLLRTEIARSTVHKEKDIQSAARQASLMQRARWETFVARNSSKRMSRCETQKVWPPIPLRPTNLFRIKLKKMHLYLVHEASSSDTQTGFLAHLK